jgi:integrase
MPLHVAPPNARSPNCRIRGTVRRIPVDRSAGTPNRRAAQELAVKIEAELLERSIHGPPTAESEPLFAQAVKNYLAEAGRSQGTHYWLVPLARHFGLRRLSEIDQAAIDAYVAVRHPGAKPATVARATIAPLVAVLRHAGVTTRFRRPKIKNQKTRYLTHAEAGRLIEAAAPHLKPLIIFMLNTGARLSEALYLDWEQVDLERRRVVFLDTRNGESRGCSLNTKAFEALANIPFPNEKKKVREGAVFRTEEKQAYQERIGGGGQIKSAWRTACIKARICEPVRTADGKVLVKDKKVVMRPTASPHTLRHTFASWLAIKGVPLRTLAELLGHKTLAMVMRYSHLSPDHLAAAVSLLDDEVGKKSGESGEKEAKAQ